MRFSLGRARTLLFEVPRTAKLAYCLLRDDRVPRAPKLAVGAALALVLSPLDVPAWVPVIGDLDLLALAVLAIKVFVDACPEHVVSEHRQALERGDSRFDRDLRVGLVVARDGVRRVVGGGRERLAGIAAAHSEDEPA